MSHMRIICRLVYGAVVGGALLIGPVASACSVCYGDPDSDMAKGAVAGVFLLGAVIGGVLLGVAGVICFWTVRARRFSRETPLENSSD